MSVSGTDVKWKKAAATASDDTSSTGGAPGSDMVHDTAGQFFTYMVAKTSGILDDTGDIEVQYQMPHCVNEHATDTALNVRFWIVNGIQQPSGAGAAKYQSTSASDGSSKKVRRWGVRDGASALSYSDTILNGTTEVTSSVTDWVRVEREEVLYVSDDSPAPLAGDLTVKNGAETIALLPAGCNGGTAEVYMWVPSTTGTSTTLTNRKTEPGGASWSRPYTEATALYARNNASNADMDAGVNQQIGFRLVLQPGIEGFNLHLVVEAIGE